MDRTSKFLTEPLNRENFSRRQFFTVPRNRRRQADGSRSGVAMSGVVDSGREIGHGDIDANDPYRRFATRLQCSAADAECS
jgi:hypothetical protein